MTSQTGKRRRLALGLSLAASVSVAAGFALLTGEGAPQSSLPSLAVKAATNASFTLSGPAVVSEMPKVVVERGTISLARTPGRGFAESDIFALLSSGQAEVILDGAVVSIEEPGTDAAQGSSMIAPAAPFVSTLAALNFSKLSLRRSTVTFTGAGGTRATFTAVDADVMKKRDTSVTGSGTATFRGEPIKFEGSMGIPPRQKSEALLPLKLRLTSDLFTAKLDGRVTVGHNLQLTAPSAELSTVRLRDLARLLGSEWPDAPGLDTLSAKGPFEWSEGTATFDAATISIDGNAASGSLALSPGKSRPRLEGTLAFDELRLDPYVTAPAESGALLTFARALVWLPLPGLSGASHPSLINALDTDLRISAASVTLNGSEVGHGAATVAIKGGVLDADLTEVILPNGATGDAHITADATQANPHYTLNGKLDRLDLGRATEVLFGAPVFKGEGAIDVDLKAAGTSGQSFLETLGGKLDIRAPGTASLEANFAPLFAAVQKKPQEGWSLAKGSTPLEDLAVRLSIKDGVMTADGVKGRFGRTELELTGSVNTANRTLDAAVLSTDEFKLASPLNGRSGAVRAIELRGAWSNPSVRSAAEAPHVSR